MEKAGFCLFVSLIIETERAMSNWFVTSFGNRILWLKKQIV